MTRDHYDVVIVGAGHSGAATAAALRQKGFAGSIALVGDEPDLPYERPPLSKDYFSGEKAFDRMLIRTAAFWDERDVTLLLGQRATLVEAEAHRLLIQGQPAIDYGIMVWAAGGRARRLGCNGHDLAGVHTVRTRADIDAILSTVDSAERIVVVGGGYIGLEMASALAKRGRQVTVLEAMERVLARVSGETLSRFYEAEHRAHGVDLRLNTQVHQIIGADGCVTAVALSDGTTLACQMVIVGIGIVPSVEPLMAAGADGSNGVKVDEFCRTSLADVYAVGDCALRCNAYARGEAIRLESVQNASEQAAVAAAAIIGAPMPKQAIPWFWSNQFDLRLQTVGLSIGHDSYVLRGEIEQRSFSVIYLLNGHVIALDCVNRAKDYVQGRALVSSGAIIDPTSLADTSCELTDLRPRS